MGHLCSKFLARISNAFTELGILHLMLICICIHVLLFTDMINSWPIVIYILYYRNNGWSELKNYILQSCSNVRLWVAVTLLQLFFYFWCEDIVVVTMLQLFFIFEKTLLEHFGGRESWYEAEDQHRQERGWCRWCFTMLALAMSCKTISLQYHRSSMYVEHISALCDSMLCYSVGRQQPGGMPPKPPLWRPKR